MDRLTSWQEFMMHYAIKIEEQSMQTAPNFWLNIFILVIILCICKGILYYLLRQRVQRNKTFRILHLAKTLCTRYTCGFAQNVFRTRRNVSGNEEEHTTVGLHVFS
ncbi:PREDICTED: uncharacterized protein LOC106749839 [Dinoponera quadriceps]|uniref:Uncharacterized protein LOC106749839 n=1 Tax=Dinoponera quadriceps TaxID=609295 RepID=A0A6P3Y2W5_DINQU|nr:PREDICTED: uncharacterized protein LOC106749839 [Dinoponera quadriceps]